MTTGRAVRMLVTRPEPDAQLTVARLRALARRTPDGLAALPVTALVRGPPVVEHTGAHLHPGADAPGVLRTPLAGAVDQVHRDRAPRRVAERLGHRIFRDMRVDQPELAALDGKVDREVPDFEQAHTRLSGRSCAGRRRRAPPRR
jgi:hypothetical protein